MFRTSNLICVECIDAAENLDMITAAQLKAARAMLGIDQKTLAELADSAFYIVAERPLALDEKATTILDADAKAVLKALLPGFDALT